MRKGYRSRPMGTPRQLLLSALVGAILASAVILSMHCRLRPALTRMAGARVNNLVEQLVSEAIQTDAASGELDYKALISLEKDASGQITALHSDMASAELLRAHIVELLNQRLDSLSALEISIPIGTLTGSVLLSGRGPAIPVRILSVGAVSAEFDNQFSAAGINQTRYQVVLKVHVTVELLLPGGTAQTEVDTRLTVAETILLGQVPEYYADFSPFQGGAGMEAN